MTARRSLRSRSISARRSTRGAGGGSRTEGVTTAVMGSGGYSGGAQQPCSRRGEGSNERATRGGHGGPPLHASSASLPSLHPLQPARVEVVLVRAVVREEQAAA